MNADSGRKFGMLFTPTSGQAWRRINNRDELYKFIMSLRLGILQFAAFQIKWGPFAVKLDDKARTCLLNFATHGLVSMLSSEGAQLRLLNQQMKHTKIVGVIHAGVHSLACLRRMGVASVARYNLKDTIIDTEL
jgi:hypothetical protein